MIEDMAATPPALVPADLGVRIEGDVALVNSRDVAEAFGKEHRHVLRDIDHLLGCPDLGSLAKQGVMPFCAVRAFDQAANRETRSFDLTRDGFTLLVMGWTGPRAMQFKVAYIQAFNAMEASLKAQSPDDRFLAAVREIVAPLAVRHEGHDTAIGRVAARVDVIAEDVAYLKHVAHARRRDLSQATKNGHIEDTKVLGSRCPCCNLAEVVAPDGTRSPFAEFDHFYANSHPDGAHTWLICKPCHTELTAGRVPRQQREAKFRAYQNKRCRLPGRQQTLFG